MPWLGYFHKLASADVMVILDNVAYSRGDFVNRNQILSSGGPSYITVPISNFKSGTPINAIEISGAEWKLNHLAKIRSSYSKANYFNEIFDGISEILTNTKSVSISTLDVELINYFIKLLGLKTKLIYQSELPIMSSGSKLIEDICKHFSADAYISGPQGLDYLDIAAFESSSTELVFQEYIHPEYRQQSKRFIEKLSIIDLLFEEMPNALDILLTRESRFLSVEEKKAADFGR